MVVAEDVDGGQLRRWGDGLDLPDQPDHRCRGRGQLRLRAAAVLAAGHRKEVRPELVQRREQLGFAGPGHAQDRHDRRDADRDACPGQQRPHRAGSQREEGERHEVGKAHGAAPRFALCRFNPRHRAGTSTRWPGARPGPETWASPAMSSNSPTVTGTCWAALPPTTTTSYPPPLVARKATIGTASTFLSTLAVIATWTAAWSRNPLTVPCTTMVTCTAGAPVAPDPLAPEPLVPEPLALPAELATALTALTAPVRWVTPSGKITTAGSPTRTVGLADGTCTVTIGWVVVADSTGLPRHGGRARHHALTSDPGRTGQEHDLAKRHGTGHRQVSSQLPAIDRHRRGVRKMRAGGQVLPVAEGLQVGLQLLDVRPVGHAQLERPPHRASAVHEDHWGPVCLVDGLATSHHVAERRATRSACPRQGRSPGRRLRTRGCRRSARSATSVRIIGLAPVGTRTGDGARACAGQPPVTAQPAAPTAPAMRMVPATAVARFTVVRLTALPPSGRQGPLHLSLSCGQACGRPRSRHYP